MNPDLMWTQQGPHLGNQYLEDTALIQYLTTFVGSSIEKWHDDLVKFGDRVVYELLEHHNLCEKFPPVLEQYDAWGNRVDKIITHPSWKHMHRVSAEEGLIAIGYDQQPFSRVYQMVKLYLFSPSSGLYSCPLAMTDGAAALCKFLLEKQTGDKELSQAFKNLTSRDPEIFWTSGQWMTEKKGGSDVSSGTSTVAVPESGDCYKLYGYKWFTSAITADMAFTLAKHDGALGLFIIRLPTPPNSIQVLRMKEKLGTKQLPTAEMILNGTPAKLVSDFGAGIRNITVLVNITRIHNSINAVAYMRRIIALVRDYSFRRKAFGSCIINYPLHQKTLSDLELEFRGCLIFLIYTVTLLDKAEKQSETTLENALLRVFIPVLKLYTGKAVVRVVSEGIECIGGVGYMENSHIPGLLRDAQVFSIWEGTTNVLSLDFSRALKKTAAGSVKILNEFVRMMTGQCTEIQNRLYTEVNDLEGMVNNPYLTRHTAFSVANIIISALLTYQSVQFPSPIHIGVRDLWLQTHSPVYVLVNSSLIFNLATDTNDSGKSFSHGDLDFRGKARAKF